MTAPESVAFQGLDKNTNDKMAPLGTTNLWTFPRNGDQEDLMATPPNTLALAVGQKNALAVIGDADTLRVAFESGRQITLDGRFSGER
ncbi:hypothetical protein FNH05_21870, partial [Amycolatopsis rhizosphaerae]